MPAPKTPKPKTITVTSSATNRELLDRIEKLFDVKIQAVDKVLSQAVEDLDKRFAASAKHTIELAESVQRATDTAAIALDKRLETMNEFRSTMSDQTASFFTRQEHEAWSKGIETNLKELRENSFTKSEHVAYERGVESHNKALADTQQKATDIQALALDKRLETMNEFRATLSDQAINFYTRQEHDTWAKNIEADLKVLRESHYTKSEHDSYAHSVEVDLRMLRESRAEIGGLAKASQLYLTFVLALAGALTGIMGLVLRFLSK
jgi:phosphoribosyl-AMP cyclohydrolase